MQRWWAVPVVVMLGACEPMESSGSPLQPVAVSRAPTATPAPAAPGPRVAPAGSPEGFDFEADARLDDDDGSDSELDALALQAKMLGATPEQIARLSPPTPPGPRAAPAPAPAAVVAAPQLVWDPNQPLPDTSFGVRVLATLLDMQPPRAVLGLSDGSERVVQPGTFIVAERIVVLAIGRDAVQIAMVTPQGFYARVETQTVRALYPGSAGVGLP